MKQKRLRKLVSMILAVVMCLGLTCTAFAANIEVQNAKVGETYTAYQIFTATESDDNITYYIDANSAYYNDISGSTLFTLVGPNSESLYQVTWDEDNNDDIITFLTGLGAKGTAAGSVTATKNEDGTVSATIKDLTAGYYFVTTSTGSVVSIGTTGTVEIKEKNGAPSVDKEETTDGTAGIGDKVEYKSTIKDAANIANLVYHDVMSEGLTFNNDVSIEGMTEGTDYNVVTEGLTDGCTFEVVFTETGMAKITGDVVITYSATVNEDAVIDGEGNPNEAYVSYGNAGESTHDETITYVYDFDLSKTTSDGTALSGAEFTLADADGNLISFVKETAEDGSVSYRVATKEDTDTTTTVEAGSVNIYGLDAGTYTLTETKAPDGYNQLSESLTVTIKEDGTVTFDGSTVTVVTVVNESGSELPSTGGIGTTIFYIVGGVLVLGAAVLFVTKKRLGGEN